MDNPRQDFTSEIYKLELRNLPKFGFGELKKLLKNKLQLNPVKVKAANRNHTKDLAYVCFRSESDKNDGLEKLNGYVWKGKTITASAAKAIVDPMHRRKLDNAGNASTAVKTCLEATAPLWPMPYDDQLKQKETELLNLLKSYGTEVQKINTDLSASIDEQKIRNDGLPCVWQGYKASPQILGYRNKAEFTVGKNSSGAKTVGFRISSYIEGSIAVESVENLPHIPDKMKVAAKLFETYVQNSKFDVFNPEFYTGQFRQLAVRYSEATDEIMLIVGMHTKDMTLNDQLLEFRADLHKYFTEREGKPLNLSSLYVEQINKRESGQTTNPLEHVFGTEYITAVIHGLKFRISPSSFFQVNTAAAEILYQCAIDLSAPSSDSSILDICCGTGSIGLCFAKHCGHVLGVELNAEAIKDANVNATENNITNCKFYAGNADDYIQTLVHTAKENGDSIVAVIDPPRAGLHNRSICALRNSKGLNRIVYISCSPQSAMKNLLDLARPQSKSYKGEPFVAVQAVGVDMFPHTNHKELVVLLERLPNTNV